MAERLWTAEWKRLRLAFGVALPVPCEVCGEMVRPGQPWDLDHRLPRSKGGTNHPANLRVLHQDCNRLPSRRLAWEAKQRKRREAEAQASVRWAPLPVAQRVAPVPPPAPVEVERSRIF